MPVYIYRCQSCSVEFERIQLFSARALTRCPACHTGIVRRIPQLPAVHFKGTGWYSIDHRSPSNQNSGALPKKSDKPRSVIDAESEI